MRKSNGIGHSGDARTKLPLQAIGQFGLFSQGEDLEKQEPAPNGFARLCADQHRFHEANARIWRSLEKPQPTFVTLWLAMVYHPVKGLEYFRSIPKTSVLITSRPKDV